MSSPQIAPSERPRRGAKRAQTRQRLLDVAAELFQAEGIAVTSLDEVAARAGVTKGAIYGNFASKDELVYAVASERIERGLIAFDSATPVREQLVRIVRQAFRTRAPSRFLFELDLYVATSRELGARFIASARERHLQSARNLEPFAGELALPPLEFALTVQALVRGLLFQRASFPDLIAEDAALAALERLLR